MKLRVRISRQTSRLDVPGEQPSMAALQQLIRDTLLPAHGLSAETPFTLSLNGSEALSAADQTLASCGVVSGDLICVVLPESANANANANAANTANTATNAANTATNAGASAPCSPPSSEESRQQNQQTSNQPSSSRGAAAPPEASAPPCWEPMLCSEAGPGQAPLSLELLLHAAQSAATADTVMVAAHLLMLETGFTPQGSELVPGEMPSGWRCLGGAYRLLYSHPLCGDGAALVAALSMGPTLVINATLKVNENATAVRKLCVQPASYVTAQWAGQSAAAAFTDLNKLSRLFKDQLAYPLIAAAREAMALPVAFGLAALPPELLLRVVRLLDVRSVLRLAAVCRYFHAAAADSSLWRHLYRRDFNDGDVSRSRDTDWRELYRKCHQIRSERRHILRQRSLPVPVPMPQRPFHPLSPFTPPLVPGIIGGEYDQRPAFPPGLPLPRPRLDPLGPQRRWAGGRGADIRRGFI